MQLVLPLILAKQLILVASSAFYGTFSLSKVHTGGDKKQIIYFAWPY